MTALTTYLKLVRRAPRVLRAINRAPDLFARLVDQHFAEDAAGPGLAKALHALPGVTPLALRVDSARTAPCLSVLIPVLTQGAMSGGPNTALQIVCRMAATALAGRPASGHAPPPPQAGPRAAS